MQDKEDKIYSVCKDSMSPYLLWCLFKFQQVVMSRLFTFHHSPIIHRETISQRRCLSMLQLRQHMPLLAAAAAGACISLTASSILAIPLDISSSKLT